MFSFTKTRQQPPAQLSSGARAGLDELIGLRLHARSISLSSRRPAAPGTAGAHHSRLRGRGVDYQESRSYQPGDDIRNMDWRLTARSGKAHTKLYREERERPVIVLVDGNASMFFGTRGAFKSVIAARAATLIAWAAVRGGDRIGALLFNGAHQEIKPHGGQRGALRLINALVAASDPESGLIQHYHPGGLGEALHRLRRVVRPGSLVFILSDFYSIDDSSERELTRLRQHNDVVALQICDVLELTLPPPGRYGVTDGDQQGILDTGSAPLRAAYQTYFSDHQQAVTDLLRKCTVPLLQLLTSDDVAERLRLGLTRLSLPGLTTSAGIFTEAA
jgi:uncharacterized protein (DUF58 family)